MSDDEDFGRKEEKEEEEGEDVGKFVEATYFGSDDDEEVDDDIELSDDEDDDKGGKREDKGKEKEKERESDDDIFSGFGESEDEKEDEDDDPGFVLRGDGGGENKGKARKVGDRKKGGRKAARSDMGGEKKERKRKAERELDPSKPKKMSKTEQQAIINNQLSDSLLEKMRDAAAEDIELRNEGRPAIQKLKILDQVMSGLWKVKLWKLLLGKGLLDIMCSWLKSGKNELPDINIRVHFMKLLLEMPVKRSHLELSKIGAKILELQKSPKESKENRLLAKSIVNKWMKEIRGDHYEDEVYYPPQREMREPVAKKQDEKDPEKAWLRHQLKSDKAMYVRYRPEVSDMNFTVKPVNEAVFDHKGSGGNSEMKLRMKIKKNLKRVESNN